MDSDDAVGAAAGDGVGYAPAGGTSGTPPRTTKRTMPGSCRYVGTHRDRRAPAAGAGTRAQALAARLLAGMPRPTLRSLPRRSGQLAPAAVGLLLVAVGMFGVTRDATRVGLRMQRSVRPVAAPPIPTRRAGAESGAVAAGGRGAITTYQAEAAANTVISRVTLLRIGDATVVADLGFGSALRFNGVAVRWTGKYAVAVYYCSPSDTTATLRLNGVPASTVDFPATGTTIGVRMLVLPLVAGANTIELANPNGPAPALDRIVVDQVDQPTNAAAHPGVADTAPPIATTIAS